MRTPEGEPATIRDVGGSDIRLGAVLAKAGEGSIHEVDGRPKVVAKIFHPTLNGLQTKLAKVAAMVDAVPEGATAAGGFTVLTWPTELVWQDNRPVGYVMPRIDTANAVEIHALSNPSNRANPLANRPQWPKKATWNHLVTVAANLCVAVDVVHGVDAVIGDFQERNILVSDTCRVTLVDCDSMQFTEPTGQVYHCAVGRPEFSAPELINRDLATHLRGKESDLYALAVHIYLLLMAGNHPFLRGNWAGQGEQPGAMELARTGDWTGGRNSRLHTHPLTPPVSFLPNTIQTLFARAFTRGSTDPKARPTAAEWHSALIDIVVVDCTMGVHQVPRGCSACPWCAIDGERARRRRVPRPVVDPVVVAPKTPPVARPADSLQQPVFTPPKKVKPPFRATGPQRKPAKPPKPPQSADELGQQMYRLFLVIAIPVGIGIVIMVTWLAVYIIQQL